MTAAAPSGQGLNEIHVTRWGSGLPVLLIHGGGHGDPAGGEAKWRHQRAVAEDGYELILPDRPGSGGSPSRGPDDFRRDAHWVGELLGDGAHLVGHSYGGAISLCAAGLRPSAVRSLTLVEPAPLSIAMDDSAVREMALKVRAAADFPVPLIGLARAFKLLGIPRGLGPRPSFREIRAMAAGFHTMAHPYEWDATEAIDLIRRASVPAFVLDGGWSPAMSHNCDRLAELLGGERLTIEAGHHFPHMIDDGAPFNAALTRFLAEVERRRAPLTRQ